MIGRLRSGQSGSLKILGQEMCKASADQLVKARRQIGYIFQAHNLHRSVTALQNVQMGLEVHGNLSRSQMRDRSAKMLELVGLEQRINYYPDDLSGG